MLECLKFGNNNVPTIQVGDNIYVAVKDIGLALGVDKNTLNAIVRNHLPKELKLNKKDIDLDIAFHRFKLFTTITGACRVILGSTHPNKFEVIDYILQRHDDLEDKVLILEGKTKKEATPIDNDIPQEIENKYRTTLYSILKLKTPVVQSRKKITFHYYCISCRAADVKRSIKRFQEKHEDSKLLLRMVCNGSEPLRVWEKARSITRFRNYFNINKGHEHILDINEADVEDDSITITEV